MPQSAMTLYIYRVGWICLAKNLFIRSKSMKNTSCTRILPRSVRLLQPTSQTGLLNLLPIPNSFCQHRAVRQQGVEPVNTELLGLEHTTLAADYEALEVASGAGSAFLPRQRE